MKIWDGRSPNFCPEGAVVVQFYYFWNDEKDIDYR